MFTSILQRWAAQQLLQGLFLFIFFYFNISIATAQSPVIVITPSSIEQPRNQAQRAITVIDQAMIQRSGASNVTQLLRGVAGLHVSDLFGDGSQARLDLRGFGPTAMSNTLVLVDGRPLNNSSDTAAPDLSTIDIEDIQQIEILQGSAGVLYGNQAVGGVIHIIRNKQLLDKSSVKLDIGSYRAQKLTANVDRHVGQTQLSIDASDSSSDNYRDHNKTERQQLSFRAKRQHDSFTGFVEVQTTDEHIQTPGALLQSELDVSRTQSLSFYQQDYFDTQTDVLRFGFETAIDNTRSMQADYSKQVTDREFIQTFRPFAGSLSTQDRDTQAVALRYQQTSQKLHSQWGIRLQQTDYELVSSLGPQTIDQRINDAFVSLDWILSSRSKFQVGGRYSDQQAKVAMNNFDDSLSVFTLGYHLTMDDWKYYLRADQNYRYPTVEEHTNVPFGNPPGLKTQQGTSYEFGAEYNSDHQRFRFTLYDIQLQNEIGFDSSGFSNINLDDTRRQGVIFELTHHWTQRLNTLFSFTWLDAAITSGSFKDKDLPQVPEMTLRLDVHYEMDQNWSVGLEWIMSDEQVFGGDFANQLNRLDGYQVANLSLKYQADSWEASFRVNNLLDEKYSESGSQYTEFAPVTFIPTNYESFFPSPERNFWLSVKVMF